MKIGFIVNEDRDIDFKYTKELIKFCIKENIKPLVIKKFENILLDEKVAFLDESKLFEKADFIIVLGGDGTILRWAKKIAKYHKNILGINIGNLGYLTDVEKTEGINSIKNILNNKYKIEKRMMLSVTVNNEEYICLNEANINNGATCRMIKIGVDINNKFVDAFSADGIIVSTPTGSTAYNLSAGGPILKPDTELMAITYVCPHALFSRPYIISSSDTIRLYLENENSTAYLSLDGESCINIKYGDSVYIKKSNFYTNIIKTNDFEFYDVLRRKMVEMRK